MFTIHKTKLAMIGALVMILLIAGTVLASYYHLGPIFVAAGGWGGLAPNVSYESGTSGAYRNCAIDDDSSVWFLSYDPRNSAVETRSTNWGKQLQINNNGGLNGDVYSYYSGGSGGFMLELCSTNIGGAGSVRLVEP